jgi:hypothetical protein
MVSMINNRRSKLKIGIVVHGPEIIDSGAAQRIIDYLANFGSVKAILGGTMGRVALIDAGLEDAINIIARKQPSKSLQDLQECSDLLIILNQAKNRDSGIAFGSKVASNGMLNKPLLQIDTGGNFVAVLNGEVGEIADILAGDLGLDLINVPIFENRIIKEDGLVRRKLSGVQPRELISVNGIVVAKATDYFVEIDAREGRITAIRGAEIKRHGLEKLPEIDLEKAIIRSGEIRRTRAKPRIKRDRGEGVALIDHCAEDAFEEAKGASLALTIGDDTTAIAGDMLCRLNIPIIGVVDGDLDRLSNDTVILPGSIIVRVETGCDDIIGKRLKEELFGDGKRAFIDIGTLIKRVAEIAADHLVQVEKF